MMDTAEVRRMTYKAINDLVQAEMPPSYDSVLELTAYALGIKMDDNEEYPAELYRKFDRVWAELNY